MPTSAIPICFNMQSVSTHDQLHFYGKQSPLSDLYSLQLHACQYNTDEEGDHFPYSSAAT